MSNEYDDIVNQMYQQKSGEVQRSLYTAADTNPDQESALVKISKRSGIPVEALRLDEGMEAKRRIASQQGEDLADRAPATAAFLTNQDNAKTAHDDVLALTGIEKWFNRFKSSIGIGVDMLAFPAASAIDAVRGNDNAKEFLSQRIQKFQDMGRAAQVDAGAGFGERLANTVADLAPYLVMGPAGVPILVEQATANKGVELSDQGVQGKTLSGLAALSGATAYGMTKLPFGGGSYAAAMAKGAALNVPLGITERGVEKGVLDLTGYSAQADKVNVLDQNSIANDLAMGMLFGGLGRYHEVKAANNAAAIQDLTDTANASKLRERLPDVFKEFVKSQAYGGDLDSIGMPIEKFEELYQSTKKPIDDLLTDPTAYHEAKATGGDVQIPIEDFMTNLAPHITPEHIMDMRLRPGDDTLREAQEGSSVQESDVQEFLKAANGAEVDGGTAPDATDAAGASDTGTAARPSEMKVYDDILAKLVNANVPKDVAERQAALWSIRARTRAARSGMDAWDMYNERPVEIVRDSPANVGGEDNLWQTAWHGSPHTFDEFRMDKIGTGEGAQAYGHGLYFAGDRDVAKWYKEKLASDGWLTATGRVFNPDVIEHLNVRTLARKGDLEGAIEKARSIVNSDSPVADKAAHDLLLLEKLKAEGGIRENRGRLYKVDLAPEDHEYLNWDNPLSEQSKHVKDILTSSGAIESISTESRIAGYAKFRGMTIEQARDFLAEHPETLRRMIPVDDDATGEQIYRALAKVKGGASENASEYLHSLGIRGIKYLDGSSRGKGDGSHNYVIFHDGDVKIEEMYQDKRGYIRIGESKISIGLLEKADLSTFLHESGHAWLEELKRDAMRDGATDQIKGDWETAKKVLGIGEDGAISRDAHEKWADSFEQYLKDGKAPSAELMPLFERFKAWMIQIYQAIKGHKDIKLSKDIRGVMDRMLATDAEIEHAKDAESLRPLFADAKSAGMTEAEFEPYKKLAQKAGDEAKNALLGKLMGEMTREKSATWKQERDGIKEQVAAETQQDPVYQAMQELSKGKGFDGTETPYKLDKDALVKQYGEDFVRELAKKTVPSIFAKEGGLPQDVVAEKYGFRSGDEMIQKIMEAPSRSKFIEQESNRRMDEKYPSRLQDGSISDAALQAVHNDTQGQVLRAELKAISKLRTAAKPIVNAEKAQARQGLKDFKESIPPLEWFQAMARDHIGTKSIRDTKPIVYARAAAKAAKATEAALAKRDFAAAMEAKRQQISSQALYTEAVKAQAFVNDKVLPYMKKMEKAAAQAPIGKAGGEYLEQIQGILSRYEFSKVPYKMLDERKSLIQYLNDFAKAHPEHAIPIDPQVLDEARQINYREASFSELGAVYDATKAIEHAAKAITKALKDGRETQMSDAKDELKNRLAETHPEEQKLTTDPVLLSGFQTALRSAKKLNAEMTRVEFLIERLDGGTQGPFHDYFWNGYLAAEIKKNNLLDLVHEPLKELVDNMPKEQAERLGDRTPIYIKSLDENFSRQRLFSILMNLGNESNRDKLMRGGIPQGEINRPITEEALQEIAQHFTKADYDMAQGLWDTVGKLLPEAQALHKRWTGLELKVVEPTKLQTPYGEYAGGYWPVKFDPMASEAGQKQEVSSSVQTVQDLFGFNTGKPQTSKGYTIERSNAAEPLLLDWKRIATRHINDVATDIAYREWLDTANRLLKDGSVKRQLQLRGGEFVHDTLEKWLRRTVGQEGWGVAPNSAADTIYRAGYSHFTTAVLGLNIAGAWADIAAQQIGAFTRVDIKHMMGAYAEFAANPKKLGEFVEEKSEWRHHAEKQVDQSIQQSLDYLNANPGKWNNVMKMSLSMRTWMYKITGNIAWKAAYDEAMESGMEEKEAIRTADKVQRMTEYSGDAGSLSAMESSPVWKKILVYAGPMEVAYNAMMNNAIEIKSKKGMAPEAWGKLFAMWMAQSVVWAWARGKKQDEESWPGFISRHMLLGPLEAFPVIRDLVPYAEEAMLGKKGHVKGLAISAPLQASIDAMMSDYKAIIGEGHVGKAISDTNIAAGMLMGYPSLQIDVTGKFLVDILSGEYEPQHGMLSVIHDALYRRHHNKEMK